MSDDEEERVQFTDDLAGDNPLGEWLEWFRQPGIWQAGAAELLKHAVALALQKGIVRIKRTETGFKLALPKAWIDQQIAERFP